MRVRPWSMEKIQKAPLPAIESPSAMLNRAQGSDAMVLHEGLYSMRVARFGGFDSATVDALNSSGDFSVAAPVSAHQVQSSCNRSTSPVHTGPASLLQ